MRPTIRIGPRRVEMAMNVVIIPKRYLTFATKGRIIGFPKNASQSHRTIIPGCCIKAGKQIHGIVTSELAISAVQHVVQQIYFSTLIEPCQVELEYMMLVLSDFRLSHIYVSSSACLIMTNKRLQIRPHSLYLSV